MCMLTHRLQILLDEERYNRVTEIARERGVSTASVIREAIDRGLPTPVQRRRTAFERLMAAPDMPVGDPEDLRAELDELRGRHG